MSDGRFVRTLKAAGAVAVVAAVALTASEADAAEPGGRAPRKQRIQLVRPVRAPDADAAGTAVVTHTRRADRLSVRMRHLEPGETYTVVDSGSGAELGRVVADGRGRARLRTRVTASAPGKSDDARLDGVAVLQEGSEPFVLVGGTDPAGRGTGLDDAKFGDAFYGSLNGAGLSISMFTDGGGEHAFWAGLDVDTDDGHEYLQYYADTIGGDALPLGADGVEDLAGRAFDVVDGAGTEVVSGELPELISLEKLIDGEVTISFPDVGNASETVFEAPFTLRIADDDDTLVDVGEFSPVDLGLPDDVRAGVDVFGSWDGANGALSLYADDTGECVSVGLYVPDENGGSFHQYDASRVGDRGELPLGVDSIDDLVGRAYELRDADGNAFVTSTVPELESASDPWRCESPDDPIDPGPAPYTFWIADDSDRMELVGELETFDGGIPPGVPEIRMSFLFRGSDLGDFAMASFVVGGDIDALDVTVWAGGGRNGDADVYGYSAGRGLSDDPLPLGADSVEDLVGRLLEIRNGDGDAILSEEIPELGDGSDPFGGGWSNDAGFEAGPPPYTLFLEDEDGVLREIAELQELDLIYTPTGGTR